MKHIVFYSGGIGSFGAAYRLVTEYGIPKEDLILLFTDTMTEDEDLYRFLKETVSTFFTKYKRVPRKTKKKLGLKGKKHTCLKTIKDSRDVWQIFFDVKFLGNSRIDPCSKILKRDLARKWIKSNFTPDNCVLYLGIDWTEEHRWERSKRYWHPYKVEAPLCNKPYIDKVDFFSILERHNINKPRLYSLGFAHNNCGGFCIKSGQAQFKKLYEYFPERYAYHEQKERD